MSNVRKSPTDAEEQVAELVDDLARRMRQVESVDLEGFLAEHTEHADALRGLFPALKLLAHMSAVEGDPSVSAAGHTLPVEDLSPPADGVLGDFRLLREIGRGGMGVVYEAEQTSLERHVALKVLPFASVLRPTQLQRFENEIQIAAALDHPNIVRVFSVGCERGVHHFAMQLIEGQSLSEVIGELRKVHTGQEGVKETSAVAEGETPGDREPQSDREKDEGPSCGDVAGEDTDNIARAHITTMGSTSGAEFFRSVARIGIQAAEALEHAHGKGVVHRDIKPSNLMLDAQGHLYVTDFGLARVQSETGLTMSGDLLGTLRYMSPEQAEGRRDALDHRSDIYSLGVTLYELLTLRPAFSAEDRHQLLRQVSERAPEPPRQLNDAVPKDLETIVLKAMAREPEARYSTAMELADDLKRYLENEEIRAEPPSVARRGRKWLGRHRRVIWSVATLLVIAVIAVSVHLLTSYWGDKGMFSTPFLRRLRVEPLEKRLLLASISGTVFEDLDANGDPGLDEGLADWTVVLEPASISDPLLTMANPDADTEDQFGWELEAMGDNILVGAPKADVNGITNVGAAYLYDGSTGSLLETFSDPDPLMWDMFGTSITVVGDKVLVGTRRDWYRDERVAQQGAAYLFSIDLDPESAPVLEATFLDPHPEPDPSSTTSNFGSGITSFGTYVLIGDNHDSTLGDQAGAVFVFDSSNGNLVQTLYSPTPAAQNRFGSSPTVIGNSVLIGAPLDDVVGPDAGAAYLFDPITGDVLQTFLNPSPDPGDEFGARVARFGVNALISARYDDTDGPDLGMVYLFDSSTGELLRTFHNPMPEENHSFGVHATSGNRILSGGANMPFLFDPTTGAVLQTFHHPDGGSFRRAAFLADERVAMGSPEDVAHGGAVYVFDTVDTTTTDASGNYSFSGLDSGTYEVRQAVADGYGQTSPGVDGTHTVIIPPDGVEFSGRDFGNARQATYSSADVPKTLKDARNAAKLGVTKSTLNVPDSLTISDVNVTLSIDHLRADDLDVFLIGPDDTRVELFTDVGGLGFVNTLLDDEAATAITDGSYPFTGIFRPEGSLAALTGDASGSWTLEISDDSKRYTGTLLSWSIAITHPEPPPVGNQPPVAADDSATTPPGTPVTINVLSNDSDPDGDALNIVAFTPGNSGTVVMNGGTTLTYTPDGAFGSDTFSYAISDRNGGSDSATVNVIEGATPTVIIVPSPDVPKTIPDPHRRKGPRPVTSVVTPTDSATVDTVTVDATIVHGESDDLTVTLARPDGGPVALSHLSGNQWQAADSTAFQGQALERTWTLTIVDGDRNGSTGTLTAWSITVTPLTEGASSAGESSTMVAGTLPSSWTPPSAVSSVETANIGQTSTQPEGIDTVVHGNGTTFFVRAASVTDSPAAKDAAVDAALEELDLFPLAGELVDELAAALL